MKVVFMGTPDFAVPTLEALIDSNHEVVSVITQPDKPKGRGNKVIYTPVKEVALKHDIPVFQPKKVREPEFVAQLEEMKPDVIVVVAFGQILPKSILDLPQYGCINVHASLLPKYRGAGPIQWSIINGEKETGITTMHMDVGLDTGDMILKEVVEISEDDTGGTLHDKLMQVGGKLLIKTLGQLELGIAPREKQDDAASSYAPMLEKCMGNIDWNKDAIEIELLIRGLNPWPSAYTYLHGKLLKIWSGRVISNYYPGNVGEIVDIIKNEGVVVKCGVDNLLLSEIQLQGKKRMMTDAFLRGYEVEIGEVLGTL